MIFSVFWFAGHNSSTLMYSLKRPFIPTPDYLHNVILLCNVLQSCECRDKPNHSVKDSAESLKVQKQMPLQGQLNRIVTNIVKVNSIRHYTNCKHYRGHKNYCLHKRKSLCQIINYWQFQRARNCFNFTSCLFFTVF